LGLPVDEKADVYALGAVLYYVVAGKPPYFGHSSDEVVDLLVDTAPAPLPELASEAPAELTAIVNKAMTREPADRYEARELAEELRLYEAGRLVGAHHYSARELFRRWLRRHRAAVAIAGIALLALAVVALASTRRVLHERDAAEESRRQAVTRAEELSVKQANALIDIDAHQSLMLLDNLSLDSPWWPAARLVASALQELGIPRRLPGAIANVEALGFVDNDRYLLAKSKDRIRWWRTDTRETGELVLGGAITSYDHSEAIYLEGNTARFVDVVTGREVAKITVKSPVTLADMSSNNRLVALSSAEGVEVFDLETNKRRLVSDRPSSVVLQFTPQSDFLMLYLVVDITKDYAFPSYSDEIRASGRAEQIVAYNLETGEVNQSSHGPIRRTVGRFVMSSNGHLMAAQLDSGVAWLIFRRDGTFFSVTSGYRTIALSPDGTEHATVDRKNMVYIRTHRLGRLLHTHGGEVTALAYLPDNSGLVSAGKDNLAALWRRTSDEILHHVRHPRPVTAIAASSQSALIATACQDDRVRVWSIGQPEDFKIPVGSSDAVLHADGLGAFLTFNTKGGRPESRAPRSVGSWRHDKQALDVFATEQHIDKLAASTDGSRVAWSMDPAVIDPDVIVFEVGDRSLVRLGVNEPVTTLEFAPDNQTLAVVTGGSTVTLYDKGSATGRQLAKGLADVTAVAYSPNGATLAVAGGSSDVVLIDVASGRRETLAGHKLPTTTLAFSPDGERLMVGGIDNAIRLYPLKGGEPMIYRGHRGPAVALAFGEDGERFVSAAEDGVVLMWDIASGVFRMTRTRMRGLHDVSFPGTTVAIIADNVLSRVEDSVPREPTALKAWVQARIKETMD
jgi:WD40 repeat protein